MLDLKEIAGKHEFVTFGNVYPLEMQGMDKELAAQLQHKARYSVANILAAAAQVRAAGVPALVEPFSARMSASGSVVIRPLRQKLIYHIGIITRGLEAMTRRDPPTCRCSDKHAGRRSHHSQCRPELSGRCQFVRGSAAHEGCCPLSDRCSTDGVMLTNL